MDVIRNFLHRNPVANTNRQRANEAANQQRQNVVQSQSHGRNVLRKKTPPPHGQNIPLHDLNQEQRPEQAHGSPSRLSQRSIATRFSSRHTSLFGLSVPIPRWGKQPAEEPVHAEAPSFRVIRTFAASPADRRDQADAASNDEAPRLEDGRFAMGSTAGKYLEQRINRLPKHFDNGVANESGGFGFRDEQQRNFYVHQNQYMAGALRASRLPEHVGGRAASPEMPSLEHMSVRSGIHHNQTTQESFRLQGTQLHRYSPMHRQWESSGPEHQYKRIARQADGRVYGITENQRDIAVNAHGHRLELSENAPHQVAVSASSDGRLADFSASVDTGLRLNLAMSGEDQQPLNAKRIALGAGNTLYAINEEDELFTGQLPRTLRTATVNNLGTISEEAEDDELIPNEETVRMAQVPDFSQALEEIGFSSAARVDGFMHDDSGGVNLIVADRHDQKHSVPIESLHHRVAPGWNLSDSITLFDKTGLPHPNTGITGPIIQLHQRQQGQLAVHNGHVLVRGNDDSEEWQRSSIENVRQVEHSVDDKVYALQNGDIVQLELSTKSSSIPSDDPLLLRTPLVTTQVKEGDKIKEGGQDANEVRAFALLDDKHFITMNAAGSVAAHVDGRSVKLPFPLGGRGIRELKLDQHQALHVLTGSGSVYRMDKAEWQRLAPSVHKWKRMPLPGNRQAEHLQTNSNQQIVAISGDQRFLLGQGSEAEAPIESEGALQADDFHQRSQGEYDPYGPVTRRGNWSGATSHNVLGVGGDGGAPRAPEPSAIKRWGSKIVSHTHIIDGMGNAARSVGQRTNGRAGLENVYKEEKAQHRKLQELATTANQPVPPSLTTKLDGLADDGDADGRSGLIQSVRIASAKLAERNFHASLQLGDVHNALDQTWSGSSSQKVGKYVSDHLPPGLQREQAPRPNMVEDLVAVLRRAPVSDEDRRAEAVLDTIVHTNGLNLPYPRESERRNRGDESAIVRASLIQNTHLLHQLHDLVEKLEQIPAGDVKNSIPVHELKQQFDRLDEGFEASELQAYATTNFTNYRGLEKVYSAHKHLNQQLSSPKSALSRHIREQLNIQEKSPDALAKGLSQHVGSMHDGDVTKLSKSNETKVISPLFPIPGTPVFVTGQAGVGGASELKVDLEPGFEGAKFELSRKKTSSVSGAGIVMAIPNVVDTGGIVDPSSNESNAGFRAIAAAELAATYSHSRKDALGMSLSGGGTKKLFSTLVQKKARLIDLVSIGREHNVKSEVTNMAKLDLGAVVELRADVGRSVDDPVGAWFRSGLGVAAGVGLLRWESKSAVQRGGAGSVKTSNATQLHGLPEASASAYLRAPQVIAAHQNVVQRIPLEISSSIQVGHSKSATFETKFKVPSKVKNQDVDKIITALKKEFPDDRANIEGRLNEGASEVERLQALMQWKIDKGADWQPATNEQHAATYSLGSLSRRQQAVDSNRRQFASANRVVTLPSLGKLPQLSDESSSGSSGASSNVVLPKGALSRMLHKKPSSEPKIKWLEGCSTENQNHILGMLRRQPQFAELVKMMEEKHTEVEVTLELKESVRQDIEERILRAGSEGEKTPSAKDIQGILKNPDNVRIQMVRVLHEVAPSSSAKTLPVGLQLKSEAGIAHGQQRGIIEFEYGMNEDHPIAVNHGEGVSREERKNPIRKQLEGNNVQIS